MVTESGELVRGYPFREVAEVDGAAHADQGGLPAQRLQVRPRVVAREGGEMPLPNFPRNPYHSSSSSSFRFNKYHDKGRLGLLVVINVLPMI